MSLFKEFVPLFFSSIIFNLNLFNLVRLSEDVVESRLAEFRASLMQKAAEEGKGTTSYETDEYGRIV